MAWEVVERVEPAATFHARPLLEPAHRAVWVCRPTGPALVLGSAQRDDVVDVAACEERGVDVVRRRSGGGAVLVVPGELLWVDVVLPADDPLWVPDVARAFEWLGAVWAGALGDLGVDTAMHTGALVRSEWSSLVCFAGRGPGELIRPDGAKVVGISQRRTRAAARFQCAALVRWDPRALVELLAMSPAERARAGSELAHVAAGLPADLDALLARFLHHLPA